LTVANDLFLAIGRHQPDAAATQRLEIRAARDEGHVLFGKRELDPDVAADRTDSDDSNLQ